jgi:hypothetical protein
LPRTRFAVFSKQILSTFDHEKSRIVNPGTGANIECVEALVGSVEKHVGPIEPVAASGRNLRRKRTWSELVALTSIFRVELPGIEPDSLPGLLPSELLLRYVPFRFVSARYLRFRLRS